MNGGTTGGDGAVRTSRSLEDQDRVAALNARFDGIAAPAAIATVMTEHLLGDLAVVSSFGADSAVLLHLFAEVVPSVPVIFLDTGRHFAETLAYRDALAARLGLTDVRSITPAPAAIRADDPTGDLWSRNPDLCCHVRKTLPMLYALRDFNAWATGRKRHQAASRASLSMFEAQDGKLKFNPLWDWDAARLADHARTHDLPPHPLVAQGYPSIGCQTCTAPVAAGEDARAGRWKDSDKTECGIHFQNGRMVRR
ncbi:phosphoadenylyl-sulfate reductase [Paracoccus sp. TK19116]|uniref:Adenosine 5'-phosphosulfate reductase n=1 Tax=Paracoccus albicereus TaxID=2922394 RepID=A0ABT1MWI8_9RHOB|nr:phosphoadenylyl-sulfate reductase [Paracoccus albicereus]MCQ0971236.1 phosphoadenylyl-sulfate reductase [Paracoccus albicereus]